MKSEASIVAIFLLVLLALAFGVYGLADVSLDRKVDARLSAIEQRISRGKGRVTKGTVRMHSPDGKYLMFAELEPGANFGWQAIEGKCDCDICRSGTEQE